MDFFLAIIKPSYWFTHQHPVPEFWTYFLTALFGFMILLGIITLFLSGRKTYPKPIRTLHTKISGWAWLFGILGYMLLFFSVEQVGYLSARIWYLLWFIGAIAYICPIIRYGIKDVPNLLQQKREQQEKDKYLPKKKK